MFGFLIALSVAASPNVNENEWTTLNTSLELVLAAEVVVDVVQTRWFLGKPANPALYIEGSKYVEGNPILGRNPSGPRLYLTAAAAVIAHAAIARLLPHSYREAWQYITIVVESSVIAANYRMVGGFKLSF